MSYTDYKSCKVEDREILHGEHVCTTDKCFICNNGQLEEDYEIIFRGFV